MATEKEASCQSCASDPNFAVICSFFERFAVQCGIPHPTFAELQEMIEDTEEVPQALIDLHVKLLRKARKSFSTEKWERTLIRFSHSYLPPEDAWELETIGYKKSRVAVKLRLLKMLLDAQFDLNMKFKTDINKLSAEELRGEPLGRDKMGNNYWCQFDPTANIRVYKEDQDEETWELVAKDRDGLVSLITNLSAGENIPGLEELLNEDSTSQDVETPLLDTGQSLDNKDAIELNKDSSNVVTREDIDLDNSIMINGEKVVNGQSNCKEHVKDESELSKNNIKENEKNVLENAVSTSEPQKEIEKPSNGEVNVPSEAVHKSNSNGKSNTDEDSKISNKNNSDSIVKNETSSEKKHLPNSSKPSIKLTRKDSLKLDSTSNPNISVKSDKSDFIEEKRTNSSDNVKKLTGKESLEPSSDKSNLPESDATQTLKTMPTPQSSANKNEGLPTDISSSLPKNTSTSKDLDSEYNKKITSKEIMDSKALLGTKPSSKESFNPKPVALLPDSKTIIKKQLDEKHAAKELQSKKISDVRNKELIPGAKPALNLSKSNCKELIGSNIKDYAKTQIQNILQRPIHQINTKCVDLSNKRSVIDVTEEIKQRGALMKSNSGIFKGKGDGKSVPGSKLDEIFKKRNLSPIINHPESQPLPAHFVGTSKSQLLEKMRNTMNESYALAGFSETGKFTQPSPHNLKAPSKDAEDLSVNRLKRTGPEDLSVTASKKPHVEKDSAEPEVSEAIEEPVMLVKGEGSGRDCDMGNPGKDNENLDGNSKNDSLKDTICSKDEEKIKEPNSTDHVKDSTSNKKCVINKEIISENQAQNSIPTENRGIDLTNCKPDGILPDKILTDNKVVSNLTKSNKNDVEVSKSVEKKIPKLWSIDAICSSDSNIGKEVENQSTLQCERKITSINSNEKDQDVKSNSSKTSVTNVAICKEKDLTSKKTQENTLSSCSSTTISASTKVPDVQSKVTLDTSDEQPKQKDKPSDSNACVGENTELKGDGNKPTSESSISKNKNDLQPKGFFFGPGCVKLSNVDLKVGSNSSNSKDSDTKSENSLASKSNTVESLKPRKKSLDLDSEETPPEPKKTKVAADEGSANNDNKVKKETTKSICEISDNKEKHKTEKIELLCNSKSVVDKNGKSKGCQKVSEELQGKSKKDQPQLLPSVSTGHSKSESVSTKSDIVKSKNNEVSLVKEKPGLDSKTAGSKVFSDKSLSSNKGIADEESLTKPCSDSKISSAIVITEKRTQSTGNIPKEKQLDISHVKQVESKIEQSKDQVKSKDSVADLIVSRTQIDSKPVSKVSLDSDNVIKKTDHEGISKVCKKGILSASHSKEESTDLASTCNQPQNTSKKDDNKKVEISVSSQLKEAKVKPTESDNKSVCVPSGSAKPSSTLCDESNKTNLAGIEKSGSKSDVNKKVLAKNVKDDSQQSRNIGTRKCSITSSNIPSHSEKKSQEIENKKDTSNKVKNAKSGNTDASDRTNKTVNLLGNKSKSMTGDKYANKDLNCEKNAESKSDKPILESSAKSDDVLKISVPSDKKDEPQSKSVDTMKCNDKLSDNTKKQTNTNEEHSSNNEKSLLVGKVTIRNMSEILKPSVIESTTKPVEKNEVLGDVLDKNKIVNADNTKPVSKISLKPLSQILKPEVIAQASVSELQGALKKDISSSSKLNSKEVEKTARVGNVAVQNRLRKTVPANSEVRKASLGIANNTKEPVKKPIENPNIDKSTVIPTKQATSAKSSNKIPPEKSGESNVSKEKTGGNPETVSEGNLNEGEINITKNAEKSKPEVEISTITVRKDLHQKRNAAAINTPVETDSKVEIPVRNTRSRQRNLATLNSATKNEKPKRLKKPLDDDIEIILEKDPLALTDEESKSGQTKELKKDNPKGLSLSSFSLEPVPEKPQVKSTEQSAPSGSRKRRCSKRLASKETDEEVDPIEEKDDDPEEEEAGGKRRKMKGKRMPDVNLRRKIEAKRSRKSSTSEDEPVPDTFEGAFANFVSKKSKTTTPVSAATSKKTKGKEKIETKSDAETATEDKKLKNEKDDDSKEEPKPRKKTARASRLEIELGIDPKSLMNDDEIEPEARSVRASRRIAQIKIKEQFERRQIEDALREDGSKKKKKRDKNSDKKFIPPKSLSGKSNKKFGNESSSKKSKKSKLNETVIPEVEEIPTKKKKKKKRKAPSRAFDGRNPWASTSESSSSNEEEEEEHYDIEEEEEEIELKSDHEFSPESDLEKDDDEDYKPCRRARTARKDEEKVGVAEEEGPDYPCQKCGKSDHPEWILLCDKCDNGWHASCLRPTLMLVPEGDWFCPSCQHITLIQKLQESLKEYDRETKRRTNEELRRKRLAYVGISLNNVLPLSSQEKGQKKEDSSSGATSSDDEGSSDDETDESEEPVYQLRQRRQTLFSYRFNEYDDLINSAIQDEIDAKGVKKTIPIGVMKEEHTVPPISSQDSAEVQERPFIEGEGAVKDEAAEKETGPDKIGSKEVDNDKDDEDYEDEEEMPRVVPRGRNTLPGGRKKQRRLNSLDVSSEGDDGSDEDFKGSSSEEEEDDGDDYTDDSEDRRPVRRSSRARIARFDKEFINDDSDESDAPRRKKQKTRRIWQESESEESDTSWGQRKKKKSYSSYRPRTSRSKKKKTRKARQRIMDSDEEIVKVPKRKKPKIKYGLDDAADNLPSRRTRGRKINYQEVMGSDTEEEILKKTTKKIVSEDEDEFKVEEELKETEKNSGSESDAEEIAANSVNGRKILDDNDGEEDEECEDEEDDDDDDDDEDEEEEDDENEEEDDDDDEDDENSKLSDKHDVSADNSGNSMVAKEKLKLKIKSDTKLDTEGISTQSKQDNQNQLVSKNSTTEIKEQPKSHATPKEKENDSTCEEMPPLKMRISNQSVTALNSSAEPNLKHTAKSAHTEEASTTSTVSLDLRQKLQMALSNKLKKAQDAESKSIVSEGGSDVDAEETGEELLEEEELDELEEEDEELYQEANKSINELNINKKVVIQLQDIHSLKKMNERNVETVQKVSDELKEKPDSFRPPAISEPEKPQGIRVISPLKLMANPPTSITQSPYACLPTVGVPQQQLLPKPISDMHQPSPTLPTPPPKRRGRGRGKKQLAQEKAAQERLAQEQQLVGSGSGGSVIRGMLQSGQPHSYSPVPRHFTSQVPSVRGDSLGRDVQFPNMPRGRMPYPVQQFTPNPSPRLGRQPQQMFHSSHHPLDPSPSGGGPINMQPSSKAEPSLNNPPGNSSQGKSTPPHPTFHHRPQVPPSGIRFHPPDPSTGRHSLPFVSSSQASTRPPGSYSQYHHPTNYHYPVAGYPSMMGEDALPPAAYQGSPSQFTEHYSEMNPGTSDTSNSKSYDEDVSGGEFGGLVSYFSSQREDDLET